jgi:predicted transcriptional regulator
MAHKADILISVEERHTANMLAGKKTVELRRRAVHVQPGCRVWVYSKVPRGVIEAVGFVENVASGSPAQIWRQHGAETGITKTEFDEYFAGAKTGYAIVLREVRELKPILSLQHIRAKLRSFQPPQFFKRLTASSPELSLFETAVAR